MELNNRVALVTGASRGIGRAIAVKLARSGCRVAINYNTSQKEAEEVKAEINRSGGTAVLVKADVTSSTAVKAMFGEVNRCFSTVDILVNNAGTVRNDLVLRMKEKDWDEVLDTNLKAAFLCTRQALRRMINQEWGRIINIASVAAQRGNYGQCNYSASKGGLVSFTRSVAREAGSRNITVNAVAPGLIQTEMLETVPENHLKEVLNRQAIPRLGTPRDVASLVSFLASEEAGFITAQVINVDGGYI